MGGGSRKPSIMKEETYNTILKLVRGQMSTPRNKLTPTEENARRQYYRYRARYSVQGQPPELYFGRYESPIAWHWGVGNEWLNI